MNHKFSALLLNWYDQQGRKNLPWREKITPYRVWISEIMLQQTQVKTVIPYFQRFLARFPSITDLAAASEDEVLSLWTGLGYYARARNLHHAAKQRVTKYSGEFPNTLAALQSLSGIGKSTAGAILAIAFQQKATILDGNVKRVLSRVYALEKNTTDADLLAQLWEVATQQTPEKRADDYAQAMMDLGATICKRGKPSCELCPVGLTCVANLQDRQSEFPAKKTKKNMPIRSVQLLILHDIQSQQVFLQKRPPTGIWGGLWSFPECLMDEDPAKWCEKNLGLRIKNMASWSSFKHVFTHFQLTITPIYIDRFEYKKNVMDIQQSVWYTLKKSADRGFPTPVKRLLEILQGV